MTLPSNSITFSTLVDQCHLSEYAISEKTKQPKSIKWPKTLLSVFAGKILRLGLWPPVVGIFCKRCSDFVFNHLTLRIEPFGDFQKKFLNLETKKLIWRRSHIWRSALAILTKLSGWVVLNMVFQNPKTVWPKKFYVFF